MDKSPGLVSRFIPRLIASVIFILFVTSLLAITFKSIFIFTISKVTGYRISYAAWDGNPFGESRIRLLEVVMKSGDIVLLAESAELVFHSGDVLKEKKLAWDVTLDNVGFRRSEVPGKDGEKKSFFAAPFDSSWKYEKMFFVAESGMDMFRISGFSADSEDIKLNGALEFHYKSGDIVTEINISVSPDAAETKMGGFKEMVLKPGENGWYSSRFHIHGNIREESFKLKSDLIEINIQGGS